MNFFDSDFLLDLNFRKRERDSIFKCDKIRDFIYFRYIVYTLESYIFQRKHVYAKIKMGRKSWKIKEIIFLKFLFDPVNSLIDLSKLKNFDSNEND